MAFSDVSDSTESSTEITTLSDKSYIIGYPDKLSHGERDTTRHEVDMIVERMIPEIFSSEDLVN